VRETIRNALITVKKYFVCAHRQYQEGPRPYHNQIFIATGGIAVQILLRRWALGSRLQLGFPFSISAESATMSLLRRCSQACPTRALNWASITTGVRGFADASISAEKDDKDIVTQQPQELHADVISGAPSEPSYISLMFSGCSLVLQRNFAIAQCASTNRLGTPCRVDQRRRNVGAWIGTRCRGVGGGRIL
jgi:hypothetical protein